MNDVANINPDIIASLVINGDISKLDSTKRVQYYNALCANLGIDPLTQPFSIIKLQGKEVLYANKNCTQQLSKVYKISHELVKTETIQDVYAVTMRAKSVDRFTDEIGAVTIGALKGDALANALMKASTKAKRRAVLAFCGLGMLDETELETIRDISEPVKSNQSINYEADLKNLQPENNKAFIDPQEEKLNAEQGNALLHLLKKNGYDKKELKEFISYEFELSSILDIKQKHLIKIQQHFSVPKEATVGKS